DRRTLDRHASERGGFGGGRYARPLRQHLDRLLEGGALGGHDEIDGGAAGAARVASPSLVAVAGPEDRDRRGLAGLGTVPGRGTRPRRRPALAPADAEDLVAELPEVDASEDLVAV